MSQESPFDSRNVGGLTTRLSDDVAGSIVSRRQTGRRRRSVLVEFSDGAAHPHVADTHAASHAGTADRRDGGSSEGVKTSPPTQQAYADAGVIVEESLAGIAPCVFSQETSGAFASETSSRRVSTAGGGSSRTHAERRVIPGRRRRGRCSACGRAPTSSSRTLSPGAVIPFVCMDSRSPRGLRSASVSGAGRARAGATQWIFGCSRKAQLPVDGGVSPRARRCRYARPCALSVSRRTSRPRRVSISASVSERLALVGRSGAGSRPSCLRSAGMIG